MLCRQCRSPSYQRSGEQMKKRYSMLAAFFVLFVIPVKGQDPSVLKLTQTLSLPPDVKGNFDHFGVDLKGNRLFATPEGYKAVLVFDLKTGKPIHTIKGIGKPHAILFREDLDRIYVTDGDAGDVKIFDGKTYALLSSVKLMEDSYSIGYDPISNYLYLDHRGGAVHQYSSLLHLLHTPPSPNLPDHQPQ